MATLSNVTVAQVAAAAGVSRATASYSLSGNPKIPASTAQRVRAAAERLGYRPNPMIASLMAHIRGAKPASRGDRIAFVWVHMPKAETGSDPFLRLVLQGARRRAEKLGYMLEEFWIENAGLRDMRVSNILKARGISGVVFSPVVHGATVKLDFEWPAFACAIVGHAEWVPELNHAGHHHYHAMRLTLQKLAAMGCKRPAVILDREANDRGRRAWQASFLVYHPKPGIAPSLALTGMPQSRTELRAWLRLRKPDAVILHKPEMIRRFRAMVPLRVCPRLTALHWTEEAGDVPGVDQRFDIVAENAVDLVVNQLRSNERGIPELPRVTLFAGSWVDPVASERQSAG